MMSIICQIEVYLGDIAGLLPGHHNKVSIAIKKIICIFLFPIVMLYNIVT